jgi:transcriptional regulator of acetoin/glycerol metabolism
VRTLKDVYQHFRDAAGAQAPSAEGTARGAAGTFQELLDRDSGPLYGTSHEIYHLKRVWLPDFVRSGLDLLITGESGSGKNLVARLLHAHSNRGTEEELPLLRVECETLEPGEADSVLFGGRTQGETSSLGVLQEAGEGLVIVDEIGALAECTLARLLRVVQSRTFAPAPGAAPVPLRARVVGITRRTDRLRRELLWRFPERVHLQPLRRRRLDVFFILHGLLREHARAQGQSDDAVEWLLTPATLLALLFHPWPGNVGELHNAAAVVSARYRNAPAGMPRFFTCRAPADGPDVLTQPQARYDVWRHLARLVRETDRGRELVPVEPIDRSEIRDYATLRNFGGEEAVPCMTFAEALEFATIAYEQVDEDGRTYDDPQARVYTAETESPPLPPLLRWRFDRYGNLRSEEERWAVDFSGMSADAAYAAYLHGLRERCATMAEATEKSGLSDSTLRRHFKDHGIRQYKGKRPQK